MNFLRFMLLYEHLNCKYIFLKKKKSSLVLCFLIYHIFYKLVLEIILHII